MATTKKQFFPLNVFFVFILLIVIYGSCKENDYVFVDDAIDYDGLAEAPDRMDYILQNIKDSEDERYNAYSQIYHPVYENPMGVSRRKMLKKFGDKSYYQNNEFVNTKYSNFTKRHWWIGPFICIEQEELTEYDLNYEDKNDDDFKKVLVRHIVDEKGYVQPTGYEPEEIDDDEPEMEFSFDMKRTTVCNDEFDEYICTTVTHHRGIMKTFSTIYKCCEGYKLTNDSCVKINNESIIDTAREIDATEFMSVLFANRLNEFFFKPTTLFLPSDRAFSIFRDYRGKATKTLLHHSYNARQIIMNHIVPFIIDLTTIKNNTVFQTSYKNSYIRFNKYPSETGTELTVNCIRVINKNIQARDGRINIISGILTPVRMKIHELISNSTNYTSFKEVLKHPDYKNLLRRRKPFTLFVPSNEAYDTLPKNVRKTLKHGGKCGLSILRSHIIDEVLCLNVFARNKFQVKNSQNIVLDFQKTKDGILTINGISTVVKQDIVARDGVIHIIDKFIIPDEGINVLSLLEKYKFTKFVKILKRWKHPGSVWNSIWNRTLFIPVDSAIDKGTMSAMLFTYSTGQFIKNMEYLMLPQIVKTQYFLNNDLYPTSSKNPMTMRVNLYSNSGLFNQTKVNINMATVNCAKIVTPDLPCCSCIVHGINAWPMFVNRTILDILYDSTSFRTVLNHLRKTSLLKQLKNSSASMTFLLPYEETFNTRKKITTLLDHAVQIEEIFGNHLILDVVCCSAIQAKVWDFNSYYENFNGDRMLVTRNTDNQIVIGGAQLLKCDILASNGVIHIIDRLILSVVPSSRAEGVFLFDV